MQKIEQRLHANPVSGKKQASLLPLPNREGKNTVQHLQTRRTVLRIGVEDYLCIRVPQKGVPAGLQPGSQRFRIVKLSVVDQRISFSRPVQ